MEEQSFTMQKDHCEVIGSCMSRHTCCCQVQVDCLASAVKGLVHPVITQFWFDGNPLDGSRYKDDFLRLACESILDCVQSDGQRKKSGNVVVTPEALSASVLLNCASVEMSSYPNASNGNEGEGEKDVVKTRDIANKYLHRLDGTYSLHVMSFFSRMHFDQRIYTEKKCFHLRANCQMKCNARDIKIETMQGNDKGLLDLMALGKADDMFISFSDPAAIFITSTIETPHDDKAKASVKDFALMTPTIPTIKSSDDIAADARVDRKLLGSPCATFCKLSEVIKIFDVISVSSSDWVNRKRECLLFDLLHFHSLTPN
jgi:hypothetical protein